MDAAAERSFREFVAARTPSLWRTACALTGHQQAAEDLLQSALTKTAARWRSVRNQGNPEAYVRQAMYNEQVSWWRRRGRMVECLIRGVRRVSCSSWTVRRPTGVPSSSSSRWSPAG